MAQTDQYLLRCKIQHNVKLKDLQKRIINYKAGKRTLVTTNFQSKAPNARTKVNFWKVVH